MGPRRRKDLDIEPKDDEEETVPEGSDPARARYDLLTTKYTRLQADNARWRQIIVDPPMAKFLAVLVDDKKDLEELVVAEGRLLVRTQALVQARRELGALIEKGPYAGDLADAIQELHSLKAAFPLLVNRAVLVTQPPMVPGGVA